MRLQLHMLGIIAPLFQFAHPIEIDNSLNGAPQVDCQDTMVALTFNTEKPFTGRIYVKGLSDDDRCSRNFATNGDQNKFSMMVAQGDCNMKRTRNNEGPLEGLVFSLVLVVSFHGTFVTKADRAFRCMCFFRNIKRVTNLLDMSMIGTTELLDTAKMPTCSYDIRTESPEGLPVRFAQIGDKIYHTWECDDPRQGFLVHSCWVNDGRGNRFDLLDIDGCAIDPIIQSDVSYNEELTKAFVETHGYKFSDTAVLDYMCVLELCKKEMGECSGLVPPQCGRGKRSIRSTTNNDVIIAEGRERVSIADNVMDVTADLTMLDTLDDFTITSNAPQLLEEVNQRRLEGQERFKLLMSTPLEGQMCLSTPAFSIMISVTSILFIAALFTVLLICFKEKGLVTKYR